MSLISLPIEILIIIFYHIKIKTPSDLITAQSLVCIRKFEFFGYNLLWQHLWLVHPNGPRMNFWEPKVEEALRLDESRGKLVKSVHLDLLRSARITSESLVRMLPLFKNLRQLSISNFLADEVDGLFKTLQQLQYPIEKTSNSDNISTFKLVTLSLNFWTRKTSMISELPSGIDSAYCLSLFQSLHSLNLQVLEIKNFNFLEIPLLRLGNQLRVLRLEDVTIGVGFMNVLNSVLELETLNTLSIRFNENAAYYSFWEVDFRSLELKEIVKNGLQEFEFLIGCEKEGKQEIVIQTEAELNGFNNQLNTFLSKFTKVISLSLSSTLLPPQLNLDTFKKLKRFTLLGSLPVDRFKELKSSCEKNLIELKMEENLKAMALKRSNI